MVTHLAAPLERVAPHNRGHLPLESVARGAIIDPDDPHPVEPARPVDQHTPALGQHRVIDRVPRHPQTCGNARDGQVVDHQRLQRPAHRATRQPRPLRCCTGQVLTPGAPAPTTRAAPHTHQQRGRAVTQRLVHEPSRVGSTRQRPAAAAPAPRIWLSNPALASPPGPPPDAGPRPPDRARRDGRRRSASCQGARESGSVPHLEVPARLWGSRRWLS